MKIYTDGACSGNPGYGGWACLLTHTGEIASGSHHPATNNQMEMQAVLEGVQRLDANAKATIITDSQVVINWLVRRYKVHVDHVRPTRDAIDMVVEAMSLELEFIRVKGHAGNKYNEVVDREASRQAQALKVKLKRR